MNGTYQALERITVGVKDEHKIGSSNILSLLQIFIASVILSLLSSALNAYDLDDKLSIGGIAALGGQCQEFSEGAGASNACRGALPFRPNLSYAPTAQDALYVKLGFAAGNGLNEVSPFQLLPWAADLENDVKNINGRGRNYLLTAWYRHKFQFATNSTLRTTLGIIDATDYLDNNSFANDEYTQFMNEALVNAPQVFLPSYDLGAAVEWSFGAWLLDAVYMNVGKDEDEDEDSEVARPTDRDISDHYIYFGVELGYSIQTRAGEGNYRIVYNRTSRDFLDPTGTRAERRTGLAISFDQELGDGFGAFLRLDIQSDKAAIDYNSFNAAGIDIRGNLWGRDNDNIGLGIAYLNGGNRDIENTQVTEVYYRLATDSRLALTADFQYMRDNKRFGKDIEGFIFSLRGDAHF